MTLSFRPQPAAASVCRSEDPRLEFAAGAPRRPETGARPLARRATGSHDPRCRCVEAVVARTFHLSVAELRATSRGEAPIAFARQVAMYVSHVWFGLSLSEVGRGFDRDRTTVSHACRMVEARRDDPKVDRVVSAIESAADLWDRFARTLEDEA